MNLQPDFLDNEYPIIPLAEMVLQWEAKLSFIKLSELYKSNFYGVWGPKSVCINVTAKSHTEGLQAELWQFPIASQRIFIDCFCSVHQPMVWMWDQASFVIGISRHCWHMLWECSLSTHKADGYAQAPQCCKQEPQAHGSLWLRRNCAMCASPSMDFFSESLTSWSLCRSQGWKTVSAQKQWSCHLAFFPPLPRGEEKRQGGYCISLRVTFGWGRLVLVPRVKPSSQQCLLLCHQLSPSSPCVLYALPETKLKDSSFHPQVLPTKLSAHSAWKPAEFTNLCPSYPLELVLIFTSVLTSLPWMQPLRALTAWPPCLKCVGPYTAS